jgi:RNA polymerase sigma-70 factor, ECF subfamily
VKIIDLRNKKNISNTSTKIDATIGSRLEREEKIVPQKEISDNELVKIIRESDQERYGELIERYQGKLFAYIYRLVGSREETEDLLQDVFIKAFRNLNSFDTDKKFSSWIYRIAHNESVNHLKRKSLKRFISWEDVVSTKDKLETRDFDDDAHKTWVRREKNQEVEHALNRLPLKYKQVLVLKYYDDKSYEEISEILDKPVNTVGTLINRAKKKLAEELKNDNRGEIDM